jgi:hypothetical protein
MLHEKIDVPVHEMRLMYNRKILDSGTLRDFNVSQDAVLQLLGPRLMGGAEELQAHTIEPPKPIGFFVKLLDSSVVYLQASECDTIDAVKGMLQQKIDVPVRLLRLRYDGKFMYEGCLRDFDLKQDAVVELLPPPLIGDGKRARVEILECRAMPDDLPQIAQIFAMSEWNPVQFLAGTTVEQERMYLASLESRRTVENAIDQTVAILPQFGNMKAELNHLNKRVNAAEAYLRSLVSSKLDGMEKGAWIGMVRLHLQERV